MNYSLSGDESTELTINSKLDDSQASAKITIKPNAKVLAQKKEEEKAAQEAAAAKEREEAEAAAAAAAEAEARAAEALEQQAAENEQPQQEYSEPVYVDANGNGLIKGSNNGIYHIPGSTYYDKTTNPAAWFKTVSEAEAAGYRAPKR
ncbi:sunset domain-containing protein [Enterococcus innesii]|uniref:sunset domain-containing protein n=1 Tax=Enterococcus innesii TaxID=2839759 RepID=UPI003F6A101A